MVLRHRTRLNPEDARTEMLLEVRDHYRMHQRTPEEIASRPLFCLTWWDDEGNKNEFYSIRLEDIRVQRDRVLDRYAMRRSMRRGAYSSPDGEMIYNFRRETGYRRQT